MSIINKFLFMEGKLFSLRFNATQANKYFYYKKNPMFLFTFINWIFFLAVFIMTSSASFVDAHHIIADWGDLNNRTSRVSSRRQILSKQ